MIVRREEDTAITSILAGSSTSMNSFKEVEDAIASINSSLSTGLNPNTNATIGSLFTFTSGIALGSNHDVLSIYEVGYFTPTIIGTTKSGSGSYSINRGTYVRIGRMITFKMEIQTLSHTGTGTMRVVGLPFVNNSIPAPIDIGQTSMLTSTSSLPTGFIPENDSYILLCQNRSGNTSVPLPMDVASYISISGTYITN